MAARIDAFKAGVTNVAATAAVGRIAGGIDDDMIANHLALTGDTLVVLANKTIGAGGAGFAVFGRIELHGL